MNKSEKTMVRFNTELKEDIEQNSTLPKNFKWFPLNTFDAKIAYIYNYYKENHK